MPLLVQRLAHQQVHVVLVAEAEPDGAREVGDALHPEHVLVEPRAVVEQLPRHLHGHVLQPLGTHAAVSVCASIAWTGRTSASMPYTSRGAAARANARRMPMPSASQPTATAESAIGPTRSHR